MGKERLNNPIISDPEAVWIDSDSKIGTFEALIASIGSTKATLLINNVESVVANLTIPSTLRLEFTPNGYITVAAGRTLTVNTVNIIAGRHLIFAGAGSVVIAAGTALRSSWFSTIEKALTFIGTTECSLRVDSTISLFANNIIGANISLSIDKGVLIVPDSNEDLSIRTPITAPATQQLFYWDSGTGDLTINYNVKEVYPEWWRINVTPGTTDMTDALQFAIDAIDGDEAEVVISTQLYITEDFTIPENITLRFTPTGGLKPASSKIITIEGTNIIAGNHQVFYGDGYFVFAAGARLNVSWFASLVLANAAAGSVAVTLIQTESETIAANVTINAAVMYKFMPGAVLSINVGVTVTLASYKNVEALNNQPIATGTGSMVFTAEGTLGVSGTLNSFRSTCLTGKDDEAVQVVRHCRLKIKDGTNASTLKCELEDIWNGDTIAETDNISKGNTSGSFSLDPTGYQVTILASGLTGNCDAILSCDLTYNASGVSLIPYSVEQSSNLLVLFYDGDNCDGTTEDLTALVDTGIIFLTVTYVTDA